MSSHSLRIPALLAATLPAIAACGWDIDAEPQVPVLQFEPDSVRMDGPGETIVFLRNLGEAPSESVQLRWEDSTGFFVDGGSASVMPGTIRRLDPDDSQALSVSVETSAETPSGTRVIFLATRSRGVEDQWLPVLVDVAGASVRIINPDSTVRQGDVVPVRVEVRDGNGLPIANPNLTWFVVPASAGRAAAGRFVGYASGDARVVVQAGERADTVRLTVVPRGLVGSVALVGEGTVADRFTADLWVARGAAYTGTWGQRSDIGNTLYVWDVADPTQPRLADSVRLDAGTVNDIKVSADGKLAVATHEGSGDGRNGVTLLDLANPLHPTRIARYTTGLEAGVHNVWIDGSHVYVAIDGDGEGLAILDVSDPENPSQVSTYVGGASSVHDVYVRDGLAFVSHWDDGLAILDVGAGLAGGSPAQPRPVGGLTPLGGQTHNAWYWPSSGYVFVGEEDFAAPGSVHVVDVSDPARPTEVASITISGDPPHNFWVDETAAVLYVGWYGQGIRAFDVSGELFGRLEQQGRQIAAIQYGGQGGCPSASGAFTCSWAPHLQDGLLFVADMNRGLVILRPEF